MSALIKIAGLLAVLLIALYASGAGRATCHAGSVAALFNACDVPAAAKRS